MSDLSLSRSGYSNRRSPAALAAALALNGGAVALLIAVPMTFKVMSGDEPIYTYPIPIDPPPPPVADPPPEAKQRPAQPSMPRPARDERPIAVDPIVPLGDNGPIAINYTPIDTGPGTVTPSVVPPREPVMVKAMPDPRFADAFHPDYPPALRREGLEGRVTVRVTIDEHGRVIAVEQVSATDPAFFEATRRQALRAWRFRPATRDGMPVQSEQTLTVQFRLED